MSGVEYRIGAQRYPILNSFLRDRDRVSLIMGPLGSGKTYAAIQRILMHMVEQEPNQVGVRPSRFYAVRNCYSADSEILTERRGWVTFPELTGEDRVAMLRDGKLEWASPTYYYAKHYTGEMVGYSGEGADFLVTPDHRLYTSRPYGRSRQWQPYEFETADSAYRKSRRVKRDAEWSGRRESWVTPDLFRWLGYWWAEGSSGVYDCADGYRRHQCVLTTKKDLTEAIALTEAAGLPYTVADRLDDGYTVRIGVTDSTKPLIVALSSVGHATDKTVPPWVLDAPGECLAAFIDGFILGDGVDGRVRVAYASSLVLAGALQEMALKSGQVANVNQRDRRGQVFTINGVQTSPTSIEYSVTFMRNPGKHEPELMRNRWRREQYDGMVYCVEVPTHVVYVRRNGRASWCSQTYPDLTSTTIRDFREVFTDDLGTMKMGSLEPPTFTARFKLEDGTRVESEVIFLALDREDAVKKLRGSQATAFWLNETKELVKPILDMADLRHGRYPSKAAGLVSPTWHGIIGDTNAPDEDHWYYHLAEEDKPEGWNFFRQPGGVERTGEKDEYGREVWAINETAENLENLPDGYYVRGMAGKSDAWIAINLANEYGFVSDGKPVHPEFIDSIQVTQNEIEFDPKLPLLLGVDFGRTPAAALCQYIPQWGRFLVIDELCTDDMSQALFGPELKRYIATHYPGAKVRGWSDPAGEGKGQATEDTPRLILEAAGVPVQPAPSNNATLRRAAVANPCRRICQDGRPALLVSPKARMIRKGLAGGFQYRRLKVAGDERYTDEPDKNIYSHPVEALEYCLLGEGEGQAALAPADDWDDGEPLQTSAIM